MQTTLLGLAIALIVALVSALVAPLVVDWNHYRGAVEAEASRLTGLNVHVAGTIDARLLPTPVITLRNVEVGGAGRAPQVQARTLKVELALGPLLRGHFQASKLDLVAPQIELGLDRSGAIDWPAMSPSFHSGALTVSSVNLEDGRVVLTDAGSGSRLVLEKVWFNGNINSLSGPFNGDGAVVVGDELYGYRISGDQADNGAGIKIRLAVEPSNQPLDTDFAGTLAFDNKVPRFDGTMTVSRPVGATLANGQRVVNAPWRVSGALRATPQAAALDHLAFRYGPEERALNFTGNATLTLGAHPRLAADLSALQLDIDRALAAPDVTNRPPLLVLRGFLQAFVARAAMPIQAEIGVGVDALTIGGSNIESLHGKIGFDQTGWTIEDFKFRAPGMTDVTFNGRLTGAAAKFAFSGPGTMQSGDVDILMSWLNGRANASPSGGGKAMSAQGDVTIASDRMAVAGLTAMLGQESITGQLGYNWPTADHPARFHAELRAAELDLDAFTAFAKAAVGDTGFAPPQEGTLALDIGTATFAGVSAQGVNAQIKLDSGKLQIDRLSVGDLGGARLDVSGRIDELSSQPRGQLTLDLDAVALHGLGDILAKLAPQSADAFRRITDHIAPAKIHGVLDIGHAGASGSAAELHLTGTLATMRLDLDGKANAEPSHLASAALQLNGRIDADDGSALIALLGLDRVLAVDQLPGQLTLSATGPLNGDIQIGGKVSVSGFDSAVTGTLRFNDKRVPVGTLQIRASAGDLRPVQQTLTGQSGITLAGSASARLGINGAQLSFTDLAALIGKTRVKGSVGVDLSGPLAVNGDIEADDVDGAGLMGVLLGYPSATVTANAAGSVAPIGGGLFGLLKGAVNFKLDRVALTPALAAADLKGVAHLGGSQIALDNLDGNLAGGRVTGALSFHRDPNGVSAQVAIDLAGASASAILGPAMNLTGGTLTASLKCDGLGGSPAGLIGSLHGSGSVALRDAQFAGLDTAAFSAAMQAAGQNGAIDMAKVRAALTAALSNGKLSVPRGDATFSIAAGAMNLTHVKLQAQGGSELAVDGAIDLSNATIDARLTLSEPPPAAALIAARPELTLALKGPLGAPVRTLDASALTSWLTLSAAELQTRQIEAIEANRHAEPPGANAHAASPDAHAIPQGGVVESAVPPNLASAPVPGSLTLERLQPAAPSIVPNQSVPGSGSLSHAPAVANVPMPAPRPAEPNERRPTPPPPRGESSWLDFLFRPHH